jgi:hypothetical protein
LQLISDERDSFSAVANVRFFFRDGQLEVLLDEVPDLLPDLFCVGTRSNDPKLG